MLKKTCFSLLADIFRRQKQFLLSSLGKYNRQWIFFQKGPFMP